MNRAQELGLVVGMLPTWGRYWAQTAGIGPAIFFPENAGVYGRFVGARYRTQPVIWILGGDRAVKCEEERAIIESMAEGLREGDGGIHLWAQQRLADVGARAQAGPVGQYALGRGPGPSGSLSDGTGAQAL